MNALQVQFFFGIFAEYSKVSGNPLYAALNHGLMANNATDDETCVYKDDNYKSEAYGKLDFITQTTV
jgi:hypothetical protein